MTVCFAEEVDDLGQALDAGFAVDKSAVDCRDQACNAEARTACCHYVLVILRIGSVHVDALRSETRSRLGAVPHIVEMSLLQPVEHSFIIGEISLRGQLRLCLCLVSF